MSLYSRFQAMLVSGTSFRPHAAFRTVCSNVGISVHKLRWKRATTELKGLRNLCHQSNPSSSSPFALLQYAHKVLSTSEPKLKSSLSQEAFQMMKNIHVSNNNNLETLSDHIGHWREPPVMPARPQTPRLVQPKEMPSYKSLKMPMGEYLLHGLAHIELNAIDTCWDTVLRFSAVEKLPFGFYYDFASIAADEARHFDLLCGRLESKGTFYGAIPAHMGIWDGAEKTKNDLLGRLTVIQLVQEPRALDSWERLVEKFKSQADKDSSKLIDLICREEIDHVRKGIAWFQWLCERQSLDPIATFHAKASKYVGIVPPPFNVGARLEAGMPQEWYLPISKREPTK